MSTLVARAEQTITVYYNNTAMYYMACAITFRNYSCAIVLYFVAINKKI
jgi:hypothetical protein